MVRLMNVLLLIIALAIAATEGAIVCYMWDHKKKLCHQDETCEYKLKSRKCVAKPCKDLTVDLCGNNPKCKVVGNKCVPVSGG